MKWRRTSNTGIEDRRGGRLGGMALPMGGAGGLGLVGLLLVLLLRGGGFDVGGTLEDFSSVPQARPGELDGAPDPDRDLVDFMGFVVDDVQKTWQATFADAGQRYTTTKLVIFEEATPTGCGTGSAQTGPFYCPADGKMYLDLGFFRELSDRFGAPGDFAQAYVIAHEFGHHIQNLLGINEDVRLLQNENPDDANELSIRMELQADCFSGIWAHSAFTDRLLEPGDIDEGLDAAAAIGDDRIQRETTGRLNRESWTHGSSEQRRDWFNRGFESGVVEECNTFG